MKRLNLLLIVMILVASIGFAMTVNQTQTAFVNGDTVYYAPQEVYDYLAWGRATLPGAPFDADTRIPRGTISQMTNNPTVVDGQLVDDWTASVNGRTMQLNRLYASEAAFKTALKAALLAKVAEATQVAARDATYADSVDEIGVPVLTASVDVLDFGSATTELTFEITNTGEGELDWEITSSNGKVTVTPESGDTIDETDVVTVTVDRSGISPGTYNPTVDIASDGGSVQIILTIVVL